MFLQPNIGGLLCVKNLTLHYRKNTESTVRRKMDTLGEPLKVDKILGDENCLFRTLSKEVSFSEENHTLLRTSATQTLESSSYKAAFEAILGRSVESYLSQSRMAQVHV